MQADPKFNDSECPEAFAVFLEEEILPEFDPSPYQTVRAIVLLLEKLEMYHFNMIHDDEVEMTPWMRKLWKDDYKRLSKALDQVKLVNPE